MCENKVNSDRKGTKQNSRHSITKCLQTKSRSTNDVRPLKGSRCSWQRMNAANTLTEHHHKPPLSQDIFNVIKPIYKDLSTDDLLTRGTGWFTYLETEGWPLVIKSVNVPAAVKNGTDYVILDCDYDLENTPTKGLVVKWFFNNNEVAYQWIYGREPLAGDLTRKYVDLKYKASDDPYTKYRAMKLNKPGIDLTGEYSCVISTFADERSASASMVVYSTEEKFVLEQQKKIIDGKYGVELMCKAEGLYPEPTLDLSIESLPLKETVTATTVKRQNSLHDISLQTTLLDEELSGAAIIKCLLGIPAANYNVSHETVYYPGTTTTTATSATKSQHKMEMQELNNSEALNGGGNFTGRLSINIFLIMMHLTFVSMFMYLCF